LFLDRGFSSGFFKRRQSDSTHVLSGYFLYHRVRRCPEPSTDEQKSFAPPNGMPKSRMGNVFSVITTFLRFSQKKTKNEKPASQTALGRVLRGGVFWTRCNAEWFSNEVAAITTGCPKRDLIKDEPAELKESPQGTLLSTNFMALYYSYLNIDDDTTMQLERLHG
jgi:hypothetical protein